MLVRRVNGDDDDSGSSDNAFVSYHSAAIRWIQIVVICCRQLKCKQIDGHRHWLYGIIVWVCFFFPMPHYNYNASANLFIGVAIGLIWISFDLSAYLFNTLLIMRNRCQKKKKIIACLTN